jgi:hypothetical protein
MVDRAFKIYGSPAPVAWRYAAPVAAHDAVEAHVAATASAGK